MGVAIELRESGAVESGRRYVKAHELQQQRIPSQVPPAVYPFLPLQQLQTGAGSGPASVPPPFPMRLPEVCTVDAPQTPGEVLAVAPSGPGSVALPLEAEEPAPAAKRGGGGEGNDGSDSESGSGSVAVLDTMAPGRSNPHARPLAPSSTPSSTPPRAPQQPTTGRCSAWTLSTRQCVYTEVQVAYLRCVKNDRDFYINFNNAIAAI